MAAKTATVKTRHSATAGVVPSSGALVTAELGINTADKKLYSKDAATVFQVAPSMAEHNLKAPLDSPALTGTPTVPTPGADDTTTKVASTAFVIGQAATVAPLMDGAPAVGTSKKFARQDHVHPVDNTRAPLASPTFTGTPAAPTPAAGNNSTLLATTAFVGTALANLVGSAPGALDTLAELADALGDDPNFAATIAAQIAAKATDFDVIDGGTF